MKKTYWWRVLNLLIGIIIFTYSYVASYGDELGLCEMVNGIEQCVISYNGFVDALAFLSVALIIVAFFNLFIANVVFEKWISFAAIWIPLTLFLIAITPEYRGGWINLDPDREMVSIWMSSLFTIISIIILAYQSYKLRK